MAREDPDGFVLLWRHAAREPQFAALADELRGKVVAAARRLIGDAIDDEVLAAWAADAVVSYLVDAVVSWLVVGTPSRDDEFVEVATKGLEGLRRGWRS